MPINILMPAMSPTMEKGNLARWLVQEGDKISSGDVIAEIETDKAIMEFESSEEGTLGKILIPSGSKDVLVNTPIAVLLEEGDTLESIHSTSDSTKELMGSCQKSHDTSIAKNTHGSSETHSMIFKSHHRADKRILASPIARKIAKEKGIDLNIVKGSGPRGRIIKSDILKLSSVCTRSENSQSDNSCNDATCQLNPLSNMRRVIAERLVEAKTTIPHFYLNMEICVDALLALRKEINDSSVHNVQLSINDLIIKACSKALMKVPEVNVSWSDNGIKYYQSADISVAVSVPDGIITPVVRKADRKTVHEIAQEIRELISLARSYKLQPEQYQGGTFSISNLGMYGISSFSAIINPPQACILAVASTIKRPICDANNQIRCATMMEVTLSVDHRAVDGVSGSLFLQALKKIIESPVLILC